MKTTKKQLFAEINKVEEQDDGTIKVWGYASSEVVDSDGETITSGAMKAAMPDYLKFGAVREMHKADAAGTAIEMEVGEDGRTFFGAHVVDPVACKKVQTKVYKGFSIGGRVLSRDSANKSIIDGIQLIEISLVDRPANPEAVFTMYKAEGIDEQPDSPTEEEVAVEDLAKHFQEGTLKPTEVLAKALAPVEKGMYTVSDFASLLSWLNSIQQETEWEAEWEGDGSTLPAQLKAWCAAGCEILKAMVAEETEELVATMTDPDEVAMAATADLNKVDHIQEAVAKAMAPFLAERETLEKRIKELEAQPEVGKAVLKVVGKGEELGPVDDGAELQKQQDDEARMAALTPEQRAVELVKKAHQSGGIHFQSLLK